MKEKYNALILFQIPASRFVWNIFLCIFLFNLINFFRNAKCINERMLANGIYVKKFLVTFNYKTRDCTKPFFRSTLAHWKSKFKTSTSRFFKRN